MKTEEHSLTEEQTVKMVNNRTGLNGRLDITRSTKK